MGDLWLTPNPGCLRPGLSWFIQWISFASDFCCCYFCESSYLFYLRFNFDFYVSKMVHLRPGILLRRPGGWVSKKPMKAELRAKVGRPQTSWSPLAISLLAVSRRPFCIGSLVILDVACCYILLIVIYWYLWWYLFVLSLFPTKCLGWDLGLNWVSFWGYS